MQIGIHYPILGVGDRTDDRNVLEDRPLNAVGDLAAHRFVVGSIERSQQPVERRVTVTASVPTVGRPTGASENGR